MHVGDKKQLATVVSSGFVVYEDVGFFCKGTSVVGVQVFLFTECFYTVTCWYIIYGVLYIYIYKRVLFNDTGCDILVTENGEGNNEFSDVDLPIYGYCQLCLLDVLTAAKGGNV